MGIYYKDVIPKWDTFYPKLVTYFKVYNHTNLPEQWKTDQSLADWVMMTRKYFSKLSNTRKKQLAQLDFLSYGEWYWLQRYEQLHTFKKKYKHCRVPSAPPYDKLYNWLMPQKANPGELSSERKIKLNKIGALTDSSLYLEEKWHQHFKELLDYKRRFKDCQVPAHWENNLKLAGWVARQRQLKEAGKLLRSRKQLLEEIGFFWSQSGDLLKTAFYDKLWVKKYRMLELYYRKYGHTLVVYEWKENPSLACWVGDQRMNYTKGKLNDEKISKLKKLDFVWDPLEAQWMEKFYLLKAFYLQHKHTRISTSSEYLPLAKWVSYTRSRKKELSKARIALLNTLSFNWTVGVRKQVSWEEMYAQLVAYKKKYGSLTGMSKNPKLAKWYYDQRTQRVKQNEERRALLKKIGVVFDKK